MSKSLQQYQLRMSRLRKIIFGEVVRPNQDVKIARLFARRPWEMTMDDYYPPFKKFDKLLWKLRCMGLYHDEHWDFTNWILTERAKTGKLKLKGEGKREMHRKEDSEIAVEAAKK